MPTLEKIGPYIKFIKGKAPSHTYDKCVEGMLPYLSPEYLRGDGEPLYVIPDSKSVIIEDEEVIILWDGSNAGEVFSAKKGVLSSTMCKVEFSGFNHSYFRYALKYEEYFLKAKTAGSGIPHADKGIVKSLEVYKPEQFEQEAIVSILKQIDGVIHSTRESIAAAEQVKKSLMQNLLTGKLKPDGAWRKEDEFYIDEKYGRVPNGWETKRVKQISIQVTDGEHLTPDRSDTGFYLLSARNIKNGWLDLSDVDYIEEKELMRIHRRCKPEEGDILISCSGTIGNVCMVPQGLIAGMVRSAALVKLDKNLIEPHYAEILFTSDSLQRQMNIAVSSSVQGNLFQGEIKKLRLFYPKDRSERDEIVKKFNVIKKQIHVKQSKLLKLTDFMPRGVFPGGG